MKWSPPTWLQNKTGRKYLNSYLLIGTIPVLCICMVCCVASIFSLRRQAEETMQFQLEQLKSELDANIAFMENSAGHLSGLLSNRGDNSLDDGMLARQLGAYQANFQLPCEILYYPRTGAEVITLNGKTNYNTFQKGGAWQYELDMIQYYTQLNCAQSRTIITTRKIDGSAGNFLIYLSPVSNMDISPVGTISFVIEKKEIDRLVESFLGDFGGYLLMYDTFYGLAYEYDQHGLYPAAEVTKSLMDISGGRGVTSQNISSESFITFRSVSNNYGFTYLYAVPSKGFYKPIYQRIRVFLLLTAGLILLLLIAAYLSAANSFKPIFRLAGDLLRGNRSGRTDLFEQIRSQYQTMAAQNDDLQQQILNQHILTRQRLLSDLLYGWRGNGEQLDKTLKQLGISFLYSDFFVMAIQLEGYPDPQKAILHASEQVRTASRRFWSIFLLETHTPYTVALLFNLDRDEETCQQAADEVAKALQDAGSPPFRIGVGRFQPEPLRISASYCEALVALQDSTVPVSLFQPPVNDANNFLCPPVEGKMLQQSILNGSEEMALDIFGQMAAEVEHRRPPFHVARCFCFYIVNLMLQIKPIVDISLPEENLIYAAGHAELKRFNSFVEEMIRALCQQVQEYRHNHQKQQADELMAYIRQNFGDYSLSVELLAGHFKLSEKAIRQILRERTGGSLTSLLTNLRMNWIKRQLAETEIPVRELINKVGYTDVSSFTRKFKQLEGVTPGQYRSMARAGQAKPPAEN